MSTNNLSQLIDHSINESISRGQTVWIDAVDMAQAGRLDPSVVCAALFVECEGDVAVHDAERPHHEYWGTDVDGNDWRVHVWTAGA